MDQRPSSVSALLIVVVSVALSVGTMFLMTPSRPEVIANPNTTIDARRLDALGQRLDALERAAQVARTADPGGAALPERTAIDRSAELLQVARIEQRLDALERRTDSDHDVRDPRTGPGQDRETPGAGPPTGQKLIQNEAIIATARQTINDLNASATDKVNAHGALRRIENAYTPEMASEMIRIGLRDPDENIRAQVWTIFDGSSARSLPVLIPSLLDASSTDTSARVRCEAVETLGNFPHDRGVIAALEYAAKNDVDHNVRSKATRTLNEMKRERMTRR